MLTLTYRADPNNLPRIILFLNTLVVMLTLLYARQRMILMQSRDKYNIYSRTSLGINVTFMNLDSQTAYAKLFSKRLSTL